MFRWAGRMFRREWRQQVLVLCLLTAAVAASVVFATLATNAVPGPTAEFGGANASVRVDGTDPALAAATIAAVQDRFNSVDVIAHRAILVPGTLQHLDVRDSDPNGTYTATVLDLRHGRSPQRAGEVALTDGAANVLDVGIGSDITVDDITWTVVGTVENPKDLSDEFALVAPGTLPSPDSYRLLVDDHDRVPAPPGGSGDTSTPQFGLEVMGSEDTAVAALVLTASTLAMTLVGLIAASGFAVVAQRRQRQLGLLSAIGATTRHVRMAVVSNGVILGVIAAVLGTAAGVGGWLLAAPAVEIAANHRVDRFHLPWVLIAVLALLAIVVATLAAWWPARAASRIPVMTALSGRPPRSRAVRRSLVATAVLIAGGVTGVALSHPTSAHVQPLLLVAGIVGIVIGTVFAAPAAIRVLGALAHRLPFAPRLACRDLARSQARSAAALAAITLALGIAVSVIVIASTNEYSVDEGNLSTHQLLIRVGDPHTDLQPDLTAAEVDQLDARAATVVAALGGDGSSVALDVAFNPSNLDPSMREPISLGARIDDHSIRWIAYPYVQTPELLALYDVDPASIGPSTEVLTQRTDPMVLLDIQKRDGPDAAKARTQAAALPTYSSAPNAIITTATMEQHGWITARAGWIVESPGALTVEQIRAARGAAAVAGLAIEVRSTQDGISQLRWDSTLVGVLLALAIVTMTVGLIRGESRQDLTTLTATGASPRTRRALAASTAIALSVLGILLGTVGAYIALVAAFHSELDSLVPVPFPQLLTLALGLPLLSAIGGWLMARREPATFSRRVLD